jgi:hypothetical protein
VKRAALKRGAKKVFVIQYLGAYPMPSAMAAAAVCGGAPFSAPYSVGRLFTL